jgi:hypothetical protein
MNSSQCNDGDNPAFSLWWTFYSKTAEITLADLYQMPPKRSRASCVASPALALENALELRSKGIRKTASSFFIEHSIWL